MTRIGQCRLCLRPADTRTHAENTLKSPEKKRQENNQKTFRKWIESWTTAKGRRCREITESISIDLEWTIAHNNLGAKLDWQFTWLHINRWLHISALSGRHFETATQWKSSCIHRYWDTVLRKSCQNNAFSLQFYNVGVVF